MFKRLLSSVVIVTFAFSFIGPYQSAHADVLNLPTPGTMVNVSPNFEPALIKGLTVHKDNPFLFDFIVDPGQSHLSSSQLKQESDRMIRYFFASLTIPNKDIWVNLSPYEKDRMIPQTLGETVMGRDLLAQDYLLKQLTASLIYPQKDLGKEFWNRVYSKAKQMYGTTQIPVNTFNKVWIVPQRAGVYEHGQTAYIVDGHLKVMLEEDYLATTKHNAIGNSSASKLSTNQLGSQVIRQIILPEIEKEVNDGKNFATLRQIFYAQVLAVWFKRNLKQALLNQVYANKSTVKGIDQNTTVTNEAIYQQYLKAYKKGVFNYINEDIDPVTQETMPRKYFSGGYSLQDVDGALVAVNPSEASLRAHIAKDVDVAALVETNPNEANALTHNVDTGLRVGGIDLRGINITSASEVAAFLHGLGLPVSGSGGHVIIIDSQVIDISQPGTFEEAFEREARAVGALKPEEMTPEDKAMLGNLSTWFNTVLGVHFIGIGTLAAAIVKSTREFYKGKNATTMAVKREYYERFRSDWIHIAGAVTIVVTGIILGAMHGINIDSIKLDLLAILTGSKIGGGVFGFEKMGDELIAASNATNDINSRKLKAVENFEGKSPRKFFFTYPDGPVFVSLFVIAYAKFPASWNPVILRHLIDYVNKVPHLGWLLPILPVLLGVGIGATLATKVDKNGPKARAIQEAFLTLEERMREWFPVENGKVTQFAEIAVTKQDLQGVIDRGRSLVKERGEVSWELLDLPEFSNEFTHALMFCGLVGVPGGHKFEKNLLIEMTDENAPVLTQLLDALQDIINQDKAVLSQSSTSMERGLRGFLRVREDNMVDFDGNLITKEDMRKVIAQGRQLVQGKGLATWRLLGNGAFSNSLTECLIYLNVVGKDQVEPNTNYNLFITVTDDNAPKLTEFLDALENIINPDAAMNADKNGEMLHDVLFSLPEQSLFVLRGMWNQIRRQSSLGYNGDKDVPIELDRSGYLGRNIILSFFNIPENDKDMPRIITAVGNYLAQKEKLDFEQVSGQNSGEQYGILRFPKGDSREKRAMANQISVELGNLMFQVTHRDDIKGNNASDEAMTGSRIETRYVIYDENGIEINSYKSSEIVSLINTIRKRIENEDMEDVIPFALVGDNIMYNFLSEANKKGLVVQNDGIWDLKRDKIPSFREWLSDQERIAEKGAVTRTSAELGKNFSEMNLNFSAKGTKVLRQLNATSYNQLVKALANPDNKKLLRGVDLKGIHQELTRAGFPSLPDFAAVAQPGPTRGGIDLSEQDAALRVTKDANGGVQVNVDPALIARVEREGISEAIPVIINIKPADMRSLFKA